MLFRSKKLKLQPNLPGDKAGDPLGVLFQPKWSVIIDAIRRSGDRGTSVLNQILNTCLWVFILFENPLEVLLNRNPTKCHKTAFRCAGRPASENYQLVVVFIGKEEGDDSLLLFKVRSAVMPATCPTSVIKAMQNQAVRRAYTGEAPRPADVGMRDLVYGPGDRLINRHSEEARQYLTDLQDTETHNWTLLRRIFDPAVTLWKELGFNMELKFVAPGEVATFCGTSFLLGPRGFRNAYVPEVLRSLATSSWSCNNDIVRLGPESPIGARLCYSSYMARAASFPDIGLSGAMRHVFKVIAESYLDHGARITDDFVLDHDSARKLGTVAGTTLNLSEFLERSTQQFSWMDEDAVNDLVAASAGPVTAEEALVLRALGTLSRHTLGARAFLPESWVAQMAPASLSQDPFSVTIAPPAAAGAAA